MGSVRPKSPLRASSRSFCIACGSTEPSKRDHRVPTERWEKTSLPGRWRWCDRPILCELSQRDCASNIDPPASSYAIMRRAGPYRGENSGPGKDDREELDTETRN